MTRLLTYNALLFIALSLQRVVVPLSVILGAELQRVVSSLP